MLQPKKTKYRKAQTGVLKGVATRGANRAFGDYAIKTVEQGFITSRQIEAARKTIVRYLRRGGKMWIRIFPDKPYTKKPLEVPMGGGKGSVEMYVAPVKPGRIIFELSGIAPELAREAFRLASHKLPVKTKILVD
ncbi:MAG: 50S ribosomal protein L16 [Candidatus Gracilibacteria bacterium]|nr:50S ribosomal protein L16 [Candidatus Gracilibacteria bacterium]MDD3119825.1 50S ribosomal protein L16 [Candidatus Gracilibacteria bacterium]MDD4530444.1 50S ribosomal protein L16 [Candidatus Gracilibacteria bacterium]